MTDATVAVFIAVLLFVLPSKAPRFCPGRSRSFEPGVGRKTQPIAHLTRILKLPSINTHSKFAGSAGALQSASSTPRLLSWKVVQKKLPWGIVLLLGGGFALAKGSEVSQTHNVNTVWLMYTRFCEMMLINNCEITSSLKLPNTPKLHIFLHDILILAFLFRYQDSLSGWEIKWLRYKTSLRGRLLSSYVCSLPPSQSAPVTWPPQHSSYPCWPQW